MTFTPKQLADFKRYEKIRQSGRYNMLSPEARAATELNEEHYWFVFHNYSALKEAQGQK